MSRLDKLKKTESLSHLAELLGYKPKAVSYILYKITEDEKYIVFEIPKKNGGKRRIKAPTEKLKHLQSRLADLLNECFDQISNESKQKSLSHGFRKNHSIVTNAEKHKNRRYVFNVDLQDFFPSINFGRVRGFFIKNNHFLLNPKVATVIAQIACHDNELPQGSPCSPIISNLIGHLLDVRMANLAKKSKCTYSRYADDLTFSTNKKDFPESIAIVKDNSNWVSGSKLIREIEKVGFSLNTKKTSMQFKSSRQMTTGLIVNEKVNIRREYYKIARAMCNELFKTGRFFLNNKNENKGTINQLEGVLSFIYYIKRPYDKSEDRRNKPNAITKLYRNFLFYRHFCSNQMPVILSEGKTDVIYLKCALKQLENVYPEFIEVKDNVTEYKISFLNFSENFKDVFGISSGTSGLYDLMGMYKYSMSKFKNNELNFPVVIIIDNDCGAEKIKRKLNIKDGDIPQKFYHFFENLYVLIIPKNKNKAIEDIFEPEVILRKIDGKTFNRNKKIDTKKEYGKSVFAEKIIREDQQNINFDGFKEVFDKLKSTIADYSQSKI